MFTLYHHPFSRAATVVWMLEEIGLPYTLIPVNIMAGEQKKPDFLALNPMGKLPVLKDDETIVTEVAAIGLYLADRYAPGRLAPKFDDPKRADYFRWSLFAPSVIEPGSMAKMSGWNVKAGTAGWGEYDSMLKSMVTAVSQGDFILGSHFSMVDCIFGGTLRYMLRFNMVEALPELVAYSERLAQRPAFKAAELRNAQVITELGLDKR